MRELILTVNEEFDGRTLQEFLRSRGFSRRIIVKLKHVKDGVTRDGVLIRTIDTVHTGIYNCTAAHHTGFKRYIQIAIRKSPIA